VIAASCHSVSCVIAASCHSVSCVIAASCHSVSCVIAASCHSLCTLFSLSSFKASCEKKIYKYVIWGEGRLYDLVLNMNIVYFLVSQMYGQGTDLCNVFVSLQWCKVRVFSAHSVESSRNGVIALANS